MFIRTTHAATTRRGIVGIAVVGCVCALAAWSIQQQDRPYDESTVLAGWRARRARPPATVEIPPGLALPETSAGEAVRPDALLLDDPRNLERQGYSPAVTTSDLVLAVTRRAVLLEGREVLAVPADSSRGFAARYGGDSARVDAMQPLASALAFAREEWSTVFGRQSEPWHMTPILLLLDRELPYRLVMDVLFTLGHSPGYVIHVAGLRDGAVVELGAMAPPRGLGCPPPRRLAIGVVADGFTLTTEDGNVAPGCLGWGPGLAVPRRGDAYDHDALAACVQRITLKREEQEAREAERMSRMMRAMTMHPLATEVPDGSAPDAAPAGALPLTERNWALTLSASTSVPFHSVVTTWSALVERSLMRPYGLRLGAPADWPTPSAGAR